MRESSLFLRLWAYFYVNNDELQDPHARAQGGSDSAPKHSHFVYVMQQNFPVARKYFRHTLTQGNLKVLGKTVPSGVRQAR